MNDIVSIRKMRPWAPPWSSAEASFPEEGDGLAGVFLPPFLTGDGVTDRAAADFARGDNQLSLAAWNWLRIRRGNRPRRTFLLALWNCSGTPGDSSAADRASAGGRHSPADPTIVPPQRPLHPSDWRETPGTGFRSAPGPRSPLHLRRFRFPP